MSRSSKSILVAAILAVLCWPGFVQSQEGPPPPRPRRGSDGKARENRPPFPPHFEQLAKLPPEERRKAQEADPRFQRMNPEQQERARRHLEEFVNLSDEQKAVIREQWTAMRDRPKDGRGRGPGPGQPGMGPGMRPGRGPGSGGMNAERRPPFPPFFEELAKLPPDERRKALEAESRFQKMSAEQQEKIRQSLEHFAGMSEDERAKIRERWAFMNNLSPQQRQRVREGFEHWNQIPADRRAAVREELRILRGLSPEEREKRIAAPEFQKNFSPAEQHLLKDLSVVR